MATLFIAQAYGVELSVGEQLSVLAVLMVTSKGAAGVTGSGFIVLASTLAAMRVVPVEGVALLLGVDRFMSEARSITNLIGNGVATLVVARSEGAFDDAKRVEAVAELAQARRQAAA
jgi:aerobic C4-dicarboxylate transport protein